MVTDWQTVFGPIHFQPRLIKKRESCLYNLRFAGCASIFNSVRTKTSGKKVDIADLL